MCGSPLSFQVVRGTTYSIWNCSLNLARSAHGHVAVPLSVFDVVPDPKPVDPAEFNTLFAAWISGAGITSANNFYCSDG